MASDQSSPAGSLPSAQVVGNAFVQQFYHVLHQSPELVYHFYQESSKLGRADAGGAMNSVTSIEAINQKILSMEYSEFRAEIKTVDAQESLNGAVIVLVTGYLTGKDNVKRDFTQSFFLDPQDKGVYYVLNDIFRYVDQDDHQHGTLGLANGIVGAPISIEQDSPPQHEQLVPEQTALPSDEEEVSGEEVYDPSDNEESSVVEKEVVVEEMIDVVKSGSQAVVSDLSPTIVHEEAPKKSYASIVKVMKENNVPLSVPVPAAAKPAPMAQEHQSVPPPGPAPAPEIPASASNATESNNIQETEADGYSIYVKSLPLNATASQLEEEFKRFGPIKPGGVQVRSHKVQGFCFGFVEFEVASAVQSALEASPIMFGGRQVYIEEKRTTGSRVSNRGRFAPGRGGGFRNDGMRGRGSYTGGRGYGRGDYSNRADFGNRGGGRGGTASRGGDVSYQRVDQGSDGSRGSRSGSLTPAVSSPKSVASRVPGPS